MVAQPHNVYRNLKKNTYWNIVCEIAEFNEIMNVKFLSKTKIHSRHCVDVCATENADFPFTFFSTINTN